ncbi:MAG TPA: GNAT family N-acetyltransferase [Chloroflexia bacterium]|nr:GNAT family N-acetyltransferase [Chloroflexia bacterium]
MVTIRAARPTDAQGIARVHVDSWRTTYRGLVLDDYLASLRYEDRQSMWDRILNDPGYRGFIYVAENEGGEVVGFVSGGPSRSEDERDAQYDGELYAIYLVESYQGKGIGRQLAKALVERMHKANLRSMLVWVIAGNPAQKFYEALGGEELRRQQFELGDVMLDEVGYGWKDTSHLL